MKRWSGLRARVESLFAPSLKLRIHCVPYRMKSQRGSTNIPRYYFQLGKEIIWDYPKDFESQLAYPYENEVSRISNILARYADTGVDDLIKKSEDQFIVRPLPNDYENLSEVLVAADRRMGLRRLERLELSSAPAKLILEHRLSLRK